MPQKRTEDVSEKDRTAEVALDRWGGFETAHYNKGKYPATQFVIFSAALHRYVSLIHGDPLNNWKVVQKINGLADTVRLRRKRIPEGVFIEAERLECLDFGGYDTYFEGDEPPGL